MIHMITSVSATYRTTAATTADAAAPPCVTGRSPSSPSTAPVDVHRRTIMRQQGRHASTPFSTPLDSRTIVDCVAAVSPPAADAIVALAVLAVFPRPESTRRDDRQVAWRRRRRRLVLSGVLTSRRLVGTRRHRLRRRRSALSELTSPSRVYRSPRRCCCCRLACLFILAGYHSL